MLLHYYEAKMRWLFILRGSIRIQHTIESHQDAATAAAQQQHPFYQHFKPSQNTLSSK